MDKIYVNPNNGCISAVLETDLTLGRLIYLIKYDYPQVENENVQIINKGRLLTDNDKQLSELGVIVNFDKLRVVPATIWKKFEQ